jgi:hypothetical protein
MIFNFSIIYIQLYQMSSVRNNQLQTSETFNENNIIFSKVESKDIPGSDPKKPLQYKTISLSSKNQDGSVGDLIVLAPELYSFGVDENTNPTNGKLEGYKLNLCLHSNTGPKDEEKAFIEMNEKIIQSIADYLKKPEVYSTIGYNKSNQLLLEAALSKLDPIYWKRDANGEKDPNKSPMLFGKLIVSKKLKKDFPSSSESKGPDVSSSSSYPIKIITSFYDSQTDDVINPLDLIKVACFVTPAIKYESIYIGSGKISLQVKIYEASVRRIDKSHKRLIKPTVKLSIESSMNSLSLSSSSSSYSSSESKSSEKIGDTTENEIVDENKQIYNQSTESEQEKPIRKTVLRKK